MSLASSGGGRSPGPVSACRSTLPNGGADLFSGVATQLQSSPQTSLPAELEQFLLYLGARNYALDTIEHRSCVLGAFVAWVGQLGIDLPEAVTETVLQQYRLKLSQHRKKNGEPLAIRTQIVRLVAVRAFFKWLTLQHKIPANPAAELELPRSEKRLPAAILSPGEVECVLAQPDVSTARGMRDRAILETLYATAIRRIELTQLRLFDIDHGRQCLLIRRGKGGKTELCQPENAHSLG
jgi:integrase/recombinase XerD